ncbi:hypothetical protein ASA1KI_29950 [Opitutales bacterium ASA1]|uniref:tetratricopeptide repeat protein n=1 Tax=Congregicoccus parvus TaxID=3081749 RepID=UPI002B28CC3A|nr:hypothetical protein ASA1KI_29950 [Opitutales bacterium ASA1]
MMRRLLPLLLCTALTARAAELGRPDIGGPEFQERVKGSYGILSDREPQITEVEIAVLGKLSPLLDANPDMAEGMLESMLGDGKPVSAAFNQVLGNLYFTKGRYNLAEAEFRNAIRKFPDFQRAWNSLGMLKMQEESYGPAAEALARSIELGAGDSQTYGMLGYALLRSREYLAAEVAYNMALLRSPGNVRWLEGKARILAETGRHEETLTATDELLRKSPSNLEYWRLQANAHLALGRLEATARSLEIARSLGTLDPGALYLLGNVYMKLGMADNALGAYLAAIELQPKGSPSFLVGVARSLVGGRQFALAERLVGTLGADSGAWSLRDRLQLQIIRARLHLEAGRETEAVAAFEAALDLDPTDPECLFRLAQVHVDAGRREKATFLLERISGDRNYEYAAQLSLTRMLIDQSRFEDAMVALRKALRITPSAELETLYNQVRVAVQSRT